MLVAVCTRDKAEQESLSKWIRQYCEVYGIACDLFVAAAPEELFQPGHSFQLVFSGLGGQEGFNLTRRLREADKRCRIVMIDDTAQFAIQGIRLHVSDYIVRPVDFKKLARAMKLATTGGGL
ncbi:MAG: hypothetical protein IJF59_02390 [Clostridia bacterium]|nr:hypothetical protein [Clostridia bacterium]MBQ3077052.1 hypothetical protein [Clostridia bacterium]